jgi:hypothetical protein
MIDRIEEVQCMIAAISHCHDRSADHSSRIVKNLSWFEYVAQNAESMVSEWVVPKLWVMTTHRASHGISQKPMW